MLAEVRRFCLRGDLLDQLQGSTLRGCRRGGEVESAGALDRSGCAAGIAHDGGEVLEQSAEAVHGGAVRQEVRVDFSSAWGDRVARGFGGLVLVGEEQRTPDATRCSRPKCTFSSVRPYRGFQWRRIESRIAEFYNPLVLGDGHEALGRLVEGYLEEYRSRGVCEATVGHTAVRLADWGYWLKSRRPRPQLEAIDAELHVRYIESRSTFRAKATAYGTLSTMRGFGEYLVRQGIWTHNPLRWMKGPKITAYSRLPQRIDRAHMEALWAEAAKRRGNFSRHLWIAVLALLYGTGLRRGELERLDIEHFDRTEGLLRIDGRKSGRERRVPVSEFVFRCLEAYWLQRHNQLERGGRLNERALLVSYECSARSLRSLDGRESAGPRRDGHRPRADRRRSCGGTGERSRGARRRVSERVDPIADRLGRNAFTALADPQRHAAIDMGLSFPAG